MSSRGSTPSELETHDPVGELGAVGWDRGWEDPWSRFAPESELDVLAPEEAAQPGAVPAPASAQAASEHALAERQALEQELGAALAPSGLPQLGRTERQRAPELYSGYTSVTRGPVVAPPVPPVSDARAEVAPPAPAPVLDAGPGSLWLRSVFVAARPWEQLPAAAVAKTGPGAVKKAPEAAKEAAYAADRTPYAAKEAAYAADRTPYAADRTPYAADRLPYAADQSPYAMNQSPYAMNQMPYAMNQMPYAMNQMPYAADQSPYATNRTPYAAGDAASAAETASAAEKAPETAEKAPETAEKAPETAKTASETAKTASETAKTVVSAEKMDPNAGKTAPPGAKTDLGAEKGPAVAPGRLLGALTGSGPPAARPASAALRQAAGTEPERPVRGAEAALQRARALLAKYVKPGPERGGGGR